jgi:hypothetical protein
MKKNKVVIFVLILLTALAVYFFYTKSSGSGTNNKGSKSDFAIKDTTSIDKIFIVDAKGQSVTLTKADGTWLVNGKYRARPDNIRLLMKTFSRIDVRYPVSKRSRSNVVKQIATSATKVEIYQGANEPSKTYYIGGPTKDHQGTYMVLETDGEISSVPFVMYIPGTYGYLSSRFFTTPELWRDAVVFKTVPQQIKRIAVTFHETPEESFFINNEDGEFSLFASGSLEPIPVISDQLIDYVSRYQNIYYEMIDIEWPQSRIDSIVSSPPFITMEVEDLSGTLNKIIIHHMPNFRGTTDTDNVIYEFDVDRMYGFLNDDIFAYIQYATFDNITLPKSYFILKK